MPEAESKPRRRCTDAVNAMKEAVFHVWCPTLGFEQKDAREITVRRWHASLAMLTEEAAETFLEDWFNADPTGPAYTTVSNGVRVFVECLNDPASGVLALDVKGEATMEFRAEEVVTDANVCEHGDHAAPAGKRFCSPECQECERADGNKRGCVGICQGAR